MQAGTAHEAILPLSCWLQFEAQLMVEEERRGERRGFGLGISCMHVGRYLLRNTA